MDWKKLSLIVVIVAAFGGYLLYRANSGTPAPSTDNTNPPPPATQQNSGGVSEPPPPPTSGTSLKDGSYTGSTVDAFLYGQVQVKAIVSGGKLTDIQVLQYPNHAGHSAELSSMALPQLKQEAIQAQSANVDAVSGATQTSQAFMVSLHSALAKAGSTENFSTQVQNP